MLKAYVWHIGQKKLQICKVTYNPAKISEKEIYKIVAKAGHDTKACKATDEAYNGLYHCCHYERPDYSNEKGSKFLFFTFYCTIF